MSRPRHEVPEIIERFEQQFIDLHNPNTYQLRVLSALSRCRTSAMGGHKYQCDHCQKEHIAYNSCGNRHCPKCQGHKQAFWVEDRMENAYAVNHYHIIFTVPEELNAICIADSKWFYNHLFACVWDTLRAFGYSHYGVESGAICILHTWGQNLSLHPHIHCIVPALGYTLKGRIREIGKNNRFLYPVKQLSSVFRGKFLSGLKKHLIKHNLLSMHNPQLQSAWSKDWVVFCSPSFGKPEHVVGYLGQYTHRIAISNHRIQEVNDKQVHFLFTDYRDNANVKLTKLTGEEFLRRFCMHILPSGFVKIRHYGIYSTRFRSTRLNHPNKIIIKLVEKTTERIKRLLGFDVQQCPYCKKGRLVSVETIPRIRSPTFEKGRLIKL